MVFSHAFTGAALTRLLDNRSTEAFTTKQRSAMYFVGIFAAVLPDLDILLLFVNRALRHRLLLSHSLSPYIMISLLIFLLSVSKNSAFIQKISVVFLVGALSHLFLDMIAGGVALWGPLNYKLVGIPLNFPKDPKMWSRAYLTSSYMLGEIALFLAYIAAVSTRKDKVLVALPLLLFTVSMISFIFLNFFYL